jgi:glycosyltransferase involved in cell wall biosynthesis
MPTTLPITEPNAAGGREPAAADGRPGEPSPGRSLKVCLASMAPFVGGAEVAAERLALGLRAAGHEVFLLLGRSGAVQERLEAAGLRCLVSPMYLTDKWTWPRYWLAKRAMARVLRRERPDVVHSNDLPTHQIVSDAARGLGAPRVCHHRFPFGGAATEWMNKFGAERHLFVSRALMDELCAGTTRLTASPRSVVYDGLPLPPAPTSDARRASRRKLGLPADGTIVTLAGQIIERKGVADLIQAWALLDDAARSGAELVIVGDDLAGQGAYRAAMERLAADVGCPARFVGFQNNVGEWLLASDVAAVPSHVEPLGNATLEAMAYALPVIGGDVGGIPEMIVHGQTGLLVPPRAPDRLATALAQLLTDARTRGEFAAAGRRRCEDLFSLDAHTRAVLAEYHSVLTAAKGVRVT